MAATSGWRTAAAAGVSVVILIALGAPAAPVFVGAAATCVWLLWRAHTSG
jgi:hypothetical protein